MKIFVKRAFTVVAIACALCVCLLPDKYAIYAFTLNCLIAAQFAAGAKVHLFSCLNLN